MRVSRMGKKKILKKPKKQIVDYDLSEDLDYYRPQKKRRGGGQKYALAGALAVVLCACVLFSPLFAVRNIRSEGTERLSTSQLCEKIGLSAGDNLILFSRSRAERVLEQDPYIAHAKLSAELPDTMVIEVSERKVRGYVPYMGSYLYIDEEGRVLDVQDSYFKALPLVRGLSFDSFQLGEILPVKNPEKLTVILRMSQLMQKYELLDLVVEIDVTNPKDIFAEVNQVQIHLGGMDNGDQKIRMMAEIMKTIPEEDRGSLDLSDLSKPIVFQYLT